jgi:WD40 repeat protein
MKRWNVSKWECSATFDVKQKIDCGAAWPEGKSLLTGSEDGVLRRWNVETGRCEAETRAHQGPVWGMAIDPAAPAVATAGDDGVIRLWLLPELIPYAGTNALRSPRPYEAMNITGATGLMPQQKDALLALGAIEMPAR